MKLKKLLAAVFCAISLGVTAASAQPEDSSTIDQCSQYNGYPSYCQNTPGCVYDFNTGFCYRPNPGPTPVQCSQYNYDPRTCNSVYGCQYDYRFNTCNPTAPVPPTPPPSRRGWCAGGVRVPSFVVRDQNEAYACARQIAAGGVDCARFATYGVCDTAGYGPGYRADPTIGWCRCDGRPGAPSPLRWDGPTYRP